jgi:hypothetical protein
MRTPLAHPGKRDQTNHFAYYMEWAQQQQFIVDLTMVASNWDVNEWSHPNER